MNEKSPIIDAIKKVMPAVVSIVATKTREEVERDIPEDMKAMIPKENGKLQIPEEEIDADGRVKVGGGSGFVVDPEGIILTNKHVIADSAARYKVILDGGGEGIDAEVVARDPVNDIAIVKIKATGLPTVDLGSSRGIELGQTVLAFGNALGIFRNTVSAGIISGLSRYISARPDPNSPMQELRGLIQTDAAINPGNSGGPLVDIGGHVIGINVAVVTGAQNISFAIPIDVAKRDLEDLKKYGTIKRPLLGLRYLILDEKLQKKFKLPVSQGAFVVPESPHDHGVVPKSPAEKAGIKERDIVVACNGVQVTAEKTLQDFLDELEPGDEIKLTVMRKGETKEFSVHLTQRK
jgi:serine protease Do